HALKVDPSTLPAGATLIATDNRDAGQPGLRFVDLVRGDLRRADFAMTGDSSAVQETEQRMIAARGRLDDLERGLGRGTAPLVAGAPAGDPRALPAQGYAAGETGPALAGDAKRVTA